MSIRLSPRETGKKRKATSAKWDNRFWELARFVSVWSKDPKAGVGAVITIRKGKGAIALGYNGFPVGVEDRAERLNDQDLKREMVVHAEQNALLIAGQAAEGAEIFVYGKPICSKCAGLIIQAGINRVISMDPYKASEDSVWRKSGILAVDMLEEAQVIVEYMDLILP